MKIAHISIMPSFSSGIFKKIQQKALISKKNDFNIDFYIINREQERISGNLYLIKKDYPSIPGDFLKVFLFRLFKLKTLEENINIDNYDAMVLRYPLVDGLGNKRFFEKYGHKIVTEHHTDEVNELLSLHRFVDRVRGYNEKFFSAKLLSRVAGMVGVTEEIRLVELSKVEGNKPSVTIANGINPENTIKTGFEVYNGNELNIVFIASHFYPWHGLELLLKHLDNAVCDVVINLHLIGNLTEPQKALVNSIKNAKLNIVAVDELYGDELDFLMSKMNVGISSLALFEIKMKEACPLKSREYIARGLPFIYGYTDTDLNGNESFAKRIDIHHFKIDDIFDFVHKIAKNKESVNQEINEYKEIVSWKRKLEQLRMFIKNTLVKES